MSTVQPLDPGFVCPTAGECSGVKRPKGRETPYASAQRDSFRFLLVIAAADPPTQLQALISNALSFTSNETLLLLHLDARVDYSTVSSVADEKAIAWLWCQPRLEISCVCVAFPEAGPPGGSLLLAHFASLAWARCRGFPARGRYVIFQASNMLWIRRGMEEHVLRHRSVAPCVHTATQCAIFHMTSSWIGIRGCFALRAGREAGVTHGCPALVCGSPPRELSTPGRCCNATTPSGCFVPPFAAARYVILTKHEGAFFPMRAAYAVLDALRVPDGALRSAISATVDAKVCSAGGATRMAVPLGETRSFWRRCSSRRGPRMSFRITHARNRYPVITRLEATLGQ